MPKYTIDVPNIKPLELALDAAIASNRRAINTSKRPEFTPVYEKEIADLMAIKVQLKIKE